MKSRLLIVGGLPNEKYNCQYGGATVLMKNFKEYLDENGCKYYFAQTNKYINTKTLQLQPIKNKMYFIIYFFAHLLFCDKVMFNFSDHATVYMFPFLCKCAKFLNKKVILRKFGGSFDLYLKKLSETKTNEVIKSLKSCDLIFLETKNAIKHLRQLINCNEKIQWFPNVRNRTLYVKDTNDFNKKLVFMSHVSDEKGIGDLLKVFKKLPSDYKLDIYGAIKEKKYVGFDWEAFGINYKGQISSEEVVRRLQDYSILLLPSYREGYPGIIIESMSVGIPSISTNVGGIPEIIENGKNGIIVPPGDIEALKNAILNINQENYSYYCNNALNVFEKMFEASNINLKVLKTIYALC